MSVSSRTPQILRHTLRTPLTCLRTQRRHARVHDIRWVTTQNATPSIADKYKEKLAQKAKAEGHESVQDLKRAYDEKIKEAKKRANTVIEPTPSQQSSGLSPIPPQSPLPQSPAASQPASSSPTAKSAGSTPGIKPLSSYLDLPKVRSLPNTEIEYLWRLRFASNPSTLCAVIPLSTYQRIHSTAKTHPRFVLPLPRPDADIPSDSAPAGQPTGTAAEIHFLQWSFHPPSGPPPAPGVETANTHTSTILFTHLAAFKVHGEYAQPHTTVTHHLDLADSHGIVLLEGRVVEGRGVSADEAKWLLMCLQKFYDYGGHGGGVGMEKRQGLLRKFTQGDAGFSLGELMDEAERIS